jgi:hypothetical protein
MDSGGGNRNVLEPRTEPGEMALELRLLSFVVVTRVLRFLRICLGVLHDVTVLDRTCMLPYRPRLKGPSACEADFRLRPRCFAGQTGSNSRNWAYWTN